MPQAQRDHLCYPPKRMHRGERSSRGRGVTIEPIEQGRLNLAAPTDETPLVVLHGDAASVLAQLPDHSVQLVVTSPPYADQRSRTYGGVHPG